MSEEFDSRKESHPTKFERRPQLLVKLSLRGLYDSELLGLRAFGNMTISLSQKIGKNEKGRRW